MLKTAAGRYSVFAILLGMSMIALFFYLEPKMIIPSLIGMTLFTGFIVLFYRIVSKKSETEQKRIAVRNGQVASVLVVVLLVAFFVAAAKHNNMDTIPFIRLLWGI